MRLSVEPAGRTEYGPGVVAELPGFVENLGHSRVFVVTDRGLRATGLVERVEKILAAAGVEHTVHEDVGPNPSTAELDRFVGRYELSSIFAIAVSREGDRLYAQGTNMPKLELFREAGRTYFVTAAPLSLTFPEGEHPAEVRVRQGPSETVARRVD